MQPAQLKPTSRNYANKFQKGTPEDAGMHFYMPKHFDITITIQRENYSIFSDSRQAHVIPSKHY